MSRSTSSHGASGGGFIRDVRLSAESATGRYPFTLPVVQQLAGIEHLALDPAVTFLVGENGTGKSTLVEGLAVAAGFLGDYLVLRWGIHKPRTGYFLRAEAYYNVATEIEYLDKQSPYPLLPAYGGVSPHERSHGESFLDLVIHRFGPNGLYVLDEPESALSVRGCLSLITRIADLVAQGSQFVIATHSPVLLAAPGARILQIDDDGAIEQVHYDQALPVALTRRFLNEPEAFLRYLLDDRDATRPDSAVT
ncbi:Predicted ATPase [Amycolatopsis marina]|uniref:Predicted ATPase n=1 Tax=Amycolatopsis marina TaxID=490629 RepID=A0A1I1CDP3_9PSEU|nr:AAA family ATPase [Amycolatopsis marina]SFB60116.1 Predicted ATPase [Amycolatopsis marina]